MDDLYEIAIREIALEGLRGTTWRNLCNELLPKVVSLAIDNFVEDVLWKNLVLQFFSVDYKKVNLFQILEALPSAKTGPSTSSTATKKSKKVVSNNETSPHQLDGYLTLEEKSTRVLFENEEQLQSLSLEERDSVVLVADKSIRFENLGVLNIEGISINPIQLCILEAVGRRRTNGIFQNFLSKELMIDNKATNYHLKRLGQANLIYKESAFEPTARVLTNIIYLKRFASGKNYTENALNETVEQYEEFRRERDNIIESTILLLKDAPNNALPESEIRRVIDNNRNFVTKHRWERMRPLLLSSPQLQCFQAYLNNGESLVNCVRLKTETQISEKEVENKVELCNNLGYLAEYPQAHQIFRFLRGKGEEGALHSEIFNFFRIDSKLSLALCKELVKQNAVKTVVEKIGKQSVFRYFVDKEDLLPQIKKEENEMEIDSSKGNATTTVLTSSSAQQENSQQSETVFATNPPPSTMESNNAVSTASQIENNFSQSTTTTNRHISKQFNERLSLAKEFLNEKVITTRPELRGYVQTKRAEQMDNKTVSRLLDYMEKNNIMKRMYVTIPRLLGTSKEYNVLIRGDLSKDDELVQNYIQRLKSESMLQKPQEKSSDEPIERIEFTRTNIASTRQSPAEKVYNAIRNNWITTKILRAKLLHYFLISLSIKQEHIVDTKLMFSELVDQMPFSVYSKLIGVTACIIENMSEYIENRTLVKDLPKELLDRLVSRSPTAHSQKLVTLLQLLAGIGVVSCSSNFSEITICQKVVAFWKDELSFTFNTMDDVQSFWMQLEEYGKSLKPVAEEEITEDTEVQQVEQVDDVRRMILNEIRSKFNWSEVKHYTIRALRLMEDTFRSNASPTAEELSALAKRNRLNFEHVVLYFFRTRAIVLRNRLEKEPTSRPRKSKRKSGKRRNVSTAKDILESKVLEIQEVEPTLEDDEDDNEMEEFSDTSSESDSEEETSTQNANKPVSLTQHARLTRLNSIPKPAKISTASVVISTSNTSTSRKNTDWSQEEDMLVVYSVCLERDYDEFGKFSTGATDWNTVFEGKIISRTVEECTVRWRSLLNRPWVKSCVSKVGAHRITLSAEDVTSPQYKATVMNFVKEALQEQVKNESTSTMSKKTEYPWHSTQSQINIELSEDPNWNASTQVSNRASLNPQEYDKLSRIQIVLLTSEEAFKPAVAHKLLSQYRPEEMEKVFSTLKGKKVVSKIGSRSFTLRGYKLNQKFHQMFSLGKFNENIYEDIKDMMSNLKSSHKNSNSASQQPISRVSIVGKTDSATDFTVRRDLFFNPICSGGEVAATLILSAMGTIDLIPQLEIPTKNGHNSVSVEPSKSLSAKNKKGGIMKHLLDSGLADIEGDPKTSNTFRNVRIQDCSIAIHSLIDPRTFIDGNEEKIQSIPGVIHVEDNVEQDEKKRKQIVDLDEDMEEDGDFESAKKQRLENSNVPKFNMALLPSHFVPIINTIIGDNLQELGPVLKCFVISQLEQMDGDTSNLHVLIQNDLIQIRDVYCEILKQKELGISMNALKQQFDDVEDYARHLLNFECIFKVDSDMEPRLISSQYKAKYSIVPYRIEETSDNNQTKKRIVYQTWSSKIVKPWYMMDGSLNTAFVEKCRRAVFSYILQNPGVTVANIEQNFNFFESAQIAFLLDELEYAEQVIYSKYIEHYRSSLSNSESHIVHTATDLDYLESRNQQASTRFVEKVFFAKFESMLSVAQTFADT